MKQLWRNLPEIFLEKLQKMVPEKNYEQIVNNFQDEKATTFRLNHNKTDKNTLEKILKENNIEYETGPIQDSYILLSPTLREFSETNIYKYGLIYVQSLSSMLPPLELDLAKDKTENILDLCAAPGSKTTQISSLTSPNSKIIANDNSRQRNFRLKYNLENQGATNVTTTFMAGQILWQKYPDFFDKTLVDVPCSMEGRFNANDPKSYSHWSNQKVKALVDRQKFLLRSAISSTKPGGTIVYSTCTFSPEENEGVIDWILKKEKSKISLIKVNFNLESMQPILAWNNKSYTNEVTKTFRVMPSHLFEGFFIAKIQKNI